MAGTMRPAMSLVLKRSTGSMEYMAALRFCGVIRIMGWEEVVKRGRRERERGGEERERGGERDREGGMEGREGALTEAAVMKSMCPLESSSFSKCSGHMDR